MNQSQNLNKYKPDPDGTFNHQLLTWPEPSSTVPYGTYVVEVLSTEQNGLSKKIDIHILINNRISFCCNRKTN
ncbi:MAG: hypothetical protein ACJZ2C_07580 [Nitrosopumilus sp.]